MLLNIHGCDCLHTKNKTGFVDQLSSKMYNVYILEHNYIMYLAATYKYGILILQYVHFVLYISLKFTLLNAIGKVGICQVICDCTTFLQMNILVKR